MTLFFSAEGGPIWIKFRRLVQNDMSTAVIWSNSKPDVEFQCGGRFGEFHDMSSHSHLPQCSVLPSGEFNVMISELRVTSQGATTGEFNGISSQSHVSHCRVLPLGEFTVMIPEPHATLQGAVAWRNQCHDRATSQGVIIPSAILKIVFRHILLFCFLIHFGLWRGAAFVASPMHLLFTQTTIATNRAVINYDNVTTLCLKKTGPLRLIWHNFTNSQNFLTIFGTERPYSILN